MLPRLSLVLAGLAVSLTVAGCTTPGLAPPVPAPTALPASAAPVVPATPDARPAQTLRLALAPLQGALDPHANCTPQLNVLLNVVYETLVYLDDDYFVKPSLAESWEVSPDSTAYTFKLYPAAYFHDGRHFDAAAARQNFDRVAALVPTALPGYLGTDKIDDYAIRVRFALPYKDFLNALSGVCMAMLSPASFGEDGGPAKGLSAGTGPFAYAASPESSALVLVQNRDYQWGPALWRQVGARYWGGSGYDASGPCRRSYLAFEHIGPAFLESLTLSFIPDPAQRAAALESAAVDAALDLAPADAARLERTGRYWVTTAVLSSTQLLTDMAAARRLRLDLQRLSPAQFAATPGAATSGAAAVVFHAARREVNCLAYGSQGWDASFYETDIRAMP